VTTESLSPAELTLGHVLVGFELDPADVIVIRHTYTADGLRDSNDLTPERMTAYTSGQSVDPRKFPREPPRLWLTFLADGGGGRCRLLRGYTNHGEQVVRRTDDWRYFNLEETDVLASLRDRLVIDWGRGAIRWWNYGPTAAKCPVVEIADRHAIPFPGFENVRVDHATLREIVNDHDPRYRDWRAALGSVHGIYVITNVVTGHLYVGKADGGRGLLGRWSQYADNGHGGNVALLAAAGLDPNHSRDFQYSILRVFSQSTLTREVDAAEEHFKLALRSKGEGLGYNR